MVRRKSTHRRSKRTKSKCTHRHHRTCKHRYYEKGGMPPIGGSGALQPYSPASVGGQQRGGVLSALSPYSIEGISVPIAKPMTGGQTQLSPGMFGGSGGDGKGDEGFRSHGKQSGGNPLAAALVPFGILGAQKYYQNHRKQGKSKRFTRAVKRYF